MKFRPTIGTQLFKAPAATYPAALDDGNTVAWFDSTESYMTKDGSDLVSQWSDRSGNDNHLLQAGADALKPVWSADGVLFDGADDYLKAVAFTLVQPEFIYMLFKQVTWTSTDKLFDGNTNDSVMVRQITGSPQIEAYAGTLSVNDSNLTLDTLGILRVLFNGASSKLQVNDNTAIEGDFGANNAGGFTLGARGAGGGNNGNIQVKEVIIRKVADAAADEANIYNYLYNKKPA